MKKEETIFLELTPKETMILSEMLGTYCWTKGPYGDDVRNIYLALDEVYHAFEHVELAMTVTQFGPVNCQTIWLDKV